jgi:hypothetical protein
MLHLCSLCSRVPVDHNKLNLVHATSSLSNLQSEGCGPSRTHCKNRANTSQMHEYLPLLVELGSQLHCNQEGTPVHNQEQSRGLVVHYCDKLSVTTATLRTSTLAADATREADVSWRTDADWETQSLLQSHCWLNAVDLYGLHYST